MGVDISAASIEQARDLAARAGRDFPVDDQPTYAATTAALWEQDHREEKYLAIAWARRWKSCVTLDSFNLYERFVVEGAWWDFVDETASHLVGTLLMSHRDEVRLIMQAWVHHVRTSSTITPFGCANGRDQPASPDT